jgi:hypothetical protein
MQERDGSDGNSESLSSANERSEPKSGGRTGRCRKAYVYLRDRENDGAEFSPDELAIASGWEVSSAKTNLTKKLPDVVQRVGRGRYRAVKVSQFSEAEFVRLMSQKLAVSADPRRPELAHNVDALVRKARESALLALQVYNNPTTVFKTEAYSVLMVLAWTALLHAVFERDGVTYFYEDEEGAPRLVDGDRKAWELATCIARYWKGMDGAVQRNLHFFIRLRNKVEHRYVPALDETIAGECQSLLLNFDELLTKEFGQYFAIRDSLAVPLQTGTVKTDGQAAALRKAQAAAFKEVKGFVDSYRAGLTDTVLEDPRYCLRVYLVPKVGNHRSSSDVAMEFVRPDPDHPEEYAELQRMIGIVRDRQVRVANDGLHSPKSVVREVERKLGRRFTTHHHMLAWKRYSARPTGKATKENAGRCKADWCVPDTRHGDYSYTDKWVTFLVEKLTDIDEYNALCSDKA